MTNVITLKRPQFNTGLSYEARLPYRRRYHLDRVEIGGMGTTSMVDIYAVRFDRGRTWRIKISGEYGEYCEGVYASEEIEDACRRLGVDLEFKHWLMMGWRPTTPCINVIELKQC